MTNWTGQTKLLSLKTSLLQELALPIVTKYQIAISFLKWQQPFLYQNPFGQEKRPTF
jgi:hypothetical protein